MILASWDFSHSYPPALAPIARQHRFQLKSSKYLKPRDYLPCHRTIQGIEFRWPIELDRSDAKDGVEQNVIWVIFGEVLGGSSYGRYLITCQHWESYKATHLASIHTLDRSANAGFITLAHSGIAAADLRENQLSGVDAREQLCRSNINNGKILGY
jgi:hypothetical protein